MMRASLSYKYNAVLPVKTAARYSMFELVVVILVVCGAYYVIIDRAMFYRRHYEVAEVQWTLAALRTAALSAQIEKHLGTKGKPAAIKKTSNPMGLLERVPANYLGEFCNPNVNELASGSWYFDNCNSKLVYIMNSEKIFAPEHPKILKFNVESLRLLTDPAKL